MFFLNFSTIFLTCFLYGLIIRIYNNSYEISLNLIAFRYAEEDEFVANEKTPVSPTKASQLNYSYRNVFKQMFNTSKLKKPSPLSASIVTWATFIFCKNSLIY